MHMGTYKCVTDAYGDMDSYGCIGYIFNQILYKFGYSSTVRCSAVQRCAVLCSAVHALCSAVQCCVVLYTHCAVLCSAV